MGKYQEQVITHFVRLADDLVSPNYESLLGNCNDACCSNVRDILFSSMARIIAARCMNQGNSVNCDTFATTAEFLETGVIPS